MKQLFSSQHDNTIDVVDLVFVEVVVDRVQTGWTVKLRAKTSFFKKKLGKQTHSVISRA